MTTTDETRNQLQGKKKNPAKPTNAWHLKQHAAKKQIDYWRNERGNHEILGAKWNGNTMNEVLSTKQF